MALESFLGGKAVLCCGDSIHFLRDQPDNRYDSCVCDPPYALVSITKRFGSNGAAAVKVPEGGSGAYARASSGFMGKKWDTGESAHAVEFWAEVLRVLKPGGHVVAFAGTRTYHRLACAIEDAGFEIRDTIQWLYGSGFPKSHNVSINIDKQIAGTGHRAKRFNAAGGETATIEKQELRADHPDYVLYANITSEAQQWEGWGTALKPAMELICLARKPLSEKTVAANVLRWGTGAINIDGCRIEGESTARLNRAEMGYHGGNLADEYTTGSIKGRWPANIIHDGSEEVLAAFPDAPGQQYSVGPEHGEKIALNTYGNFPARYATDPRGDSGSAARFFYTAKADSVDRIGSKHPTVKPVDLMQWLVRLVTPKGGLCLDPFAGTGTTAEACYREGMRCVMIERETEYQADIRRRMALIVAGPEERRRESIKAKIKGQPVDDGPLFATTA